MKLIPQALAAVVLAAAGVTALEEGYQLSEVYGGPHGDKYSDLDQIMPGSTVQSITIRAGERVNGVGLVTTDFLGMQTTLYHGGYGGDNQTLSLSKDEYINAFEAHWGKHHGRTRITYIKFTTDRNNTISGGTPTKKPENVGMDFAPKGFQLGGFTGYCGKELDSVGAIWTEIQLALE